MLSLVRTRIHFVVIASFVLALTNTADARHNRRALTPKAAAAPKPANVPEQKRDPADIALDRKIKGICRGC
jgi:hypothetical protein